MPAYARAIMLVAAIGAGALFAVLTALDWRRYGWGGVVTVVLGWMVPACIGAVVEPEMRPGIAPLWLLASLVSLGHPADWLLLMDEGEMPQELTWRQRWNTRVSPWLLMAGLVAVIVVLYVVPE